MNPKEAITRCVEEFEARTQEYLVSILNQKKYEKLHLLNYRNTKVP